MKFETLFNISFISFVQNSFDVWAWKLLLADGTVVSDSLNLHLKFLINTDVTGYAFIDKRLINQMCEKLQIIYVRLNQSKSVEEYDDQMTSKLIIHVIYSTLTVENYKKLTALMFITCFKHQDVILRSL